MSLKKSTANTRETRAKATTGHLTLTPAISRFIDDAVSDSPVAQGPSPSPDAQVQIERPALPDQIAPSPRKGGRIEKNAVKDGFSLPKETYAVINEFIKEGMAMNTQVSKSDVVRLALESIRALTPAQRRKLIDSDESLKRF